MLPLNTNIRLAYSNGKDDEQNFIQNLSLFLCTFLKEHGQLIEKRLNLRETLMEVGFVESLASEILTCIMKVFSKTLSKISTLLLISVPLMYLNSYSSMHKNICSDLISWICVFIFWIIPDQLIDHQNWIPNG